MSPTLSLKMLNTPELVGFGELEALLPKLVVLGLTSFAKLSLKTLKLARAFWFLLFCSSSLGSSKLETLTSVGSLFKFIDS